MQLRSETKNLAGEERWEKMRELAMEVYDALTEAVDEVEKEVEFNPREFLGIVLYPESIFTWVTTLFTLALGLFQSNFEEMTKSDR